MAIFFSWMSGILFLLPGVVLLFDSPLGGLSLIGVSFLLLPPARKIFHSKTDINISLLARFALIFVLIMFAGFFLVETEKAKNFEYFSENSEQILLNLRAEAAKNNHEAVVDEASKYLDSGNESIKKIHKEAQYALKEKETKKLLTDLKKIPIKEYKKNKSLYQRLVELHPNNKNYKRKLNFYVEKQEESEQKKESTQNEERVRNFSDEQICKAGIATLNGISVKSIYVLSNKKNVIKVSFKRHHDGKIFSYPCKIIDTEIKWKDPYINRWSKNLKIFYSISKDGHQLNTWTTILGETSEDLESFKKKDFN